MMRTVMNDTSSRIEMAAAKGRGDCRYAGLRLRRSAPTPRNSSTNAEN